MNKRLSATSTASVNNAGLNDTQTQITSPHQAVENNAELNKCLLDLNLQNEITNDMIQVKYKLFCFYLIESYTFFSQTMQENITPGYEFHSILLRFRHG